MRRFDLTPLLLLIPILFALLPDGLPNTADMHVHFIRAAEMVHAWQDGLLLPRWSENLGYGYGIPLFNYAPPLPYFLTAFLHTTGLPLELALKGTLVMALLIAAWGSYTLIRSAFGTLAGAVGCVAFVYAPYRLRELFIQGNVGQFLAWSFIPWAMWGVARLWDTGRIRYGIVIALSLTGALLSHNVVALVLGVLLAAQTLGLLITTGFRGDESSSRTAIRRDGWFHFWKIAFAGVGGIALAAWFSVPALLEGDFIQLNRIVASDYRTRFVPLQELIALSPPLDRAAVNPYLPLTLGLVQVGLAGMGIAAVLIARTRGVLHPSDRSLLPSFSWEANAGGHVVGGYLGLTLLGAFMAHHVSLPLWERLPFVELFEFPARWHGFTALGLAGLAGAGVSYLHGYHAAWGRWAGGIAIGLLWLSSLVNLYPQQLPLGTLRDSPADVVQFEVATGAVGTTSLAEFNPVWRTLPLTDSPLIEDYRANRIPDRVERSSLPPSAIAETIESRTEFHRLRVVLTEPATITLNLLYFPGWSATVNGVPVPLVPASKTGLAQVALPAGDNAIELSFQDTRLRRWSEWLAFTAWGGLGVLILWKGMGRRSRLRPPRLSWENGGVVALALVPVVTAYTLFPGYFAPTSPFDTAQPARVTLRADWGGELRLLGADVPAEVVKGGEHVTVVAYVRALYPLERDYAVYLHLDDPAGQTVATGDQRHPAEIPTSNLPPSLYVRIPFQITIPPDIPPMNYTWHLGWYDPETNSPLPLAEGQQDAVLGTVWVDTTERPRPVGPSARFGDTIHLRGTTLNRADNTVTLYWETTSPITDDVTIFVHLLDGNGQMVGQADGDPFGNRYRLNGWRTGHLFQETRALPGSAPYETIAIGLYRRADGVRLPAVDGNGSPLTNDALLLSIRDGRE